VDTQSTTIHNPPPPTHHLQLQPRPVVHWDADTFDNEGLGRKSSKRCCIFHKKKAFDESDTESDSDYEGPDGHGDGDGGAQGGQKGVGGIKDVKKGGKFPDFQRFHA